MLKAPRRAGPATIIQAKTLVFESLEHRHLLSGQTDWVTTNADQTMLLYTPDEFGNRIPDFSTVGYRSGSPIPQIPVKAVVAADGPDGDDSVVIQAAIDRVAELPLDAHGFRGAVLLKAGVHELEEAIEIVASGIVLRGEFDGDADNPQLNTTLVASGTANFGAVPFRPVWPDDTVTKQRYEAVTFDYRTDFIELAGSMSLHDLGVIAGQRVIFDGSNINYRVNDISSDGFRFQIDQPLRSDVEEGAFVGSSAEGHSGGLIRINPRQTWWAYRNETTDTGRFNIVDANVPVGARTIRVAPDSAGRPPLGPGDSVQLIRPGSERWVRDLGVPFEGEFEVAAVHGWTSLEASKYMDRIVTHVEALRDSSDLLVTLDAPVSISLDQEYGTAFLDRYEWQSRISNVGVEYIRGIGLPNSAQLVQQYEDGSTLTQENHAWNFVAIETARDVWVRHVRGEFFANATIFADVDATAVTIQHAQSLYPVSRIEGNRRYAFESLGQRVLFDDVHAEYARHAFVTTGSKADMNVFVNGTSRNAFAESGPHQQLSTAGLFDNIVEDKAITARRVADGEHGIRGASQVIWNSTIDYSETKSPRLTLETDRGIYTLIPTDDSYTTVYDSDSHAALGHLPVRAAGEFRPHLKFDLSSIPDDAALTRMELRLTPKIHRLSVDGVFTHELRLINTWDDWTEETLNTQKDDDGTPLDANGDLMPNGILLGDWRYRQDANFVSLSFDAYDPVESYKLQMISQQLFDDQLTLRIDPGEDAHGLAYYYSNERGSDSDQPSFIVENAYAPGSDELLVQNWLIGSSGAIDPTDRSSSSGTFASAENSVRLDVNGQPYRTLYDAQLAVRKTLDQPYADYEYREYWLGDIDRRQAGDSDDQVTADQDWKNQFPRARGFDSSPFARAIPFTFEFEALGDDKRVVAASLSLRLVDEYGMSSKDALFLDISSDGQSAKANIPFAHPELNWLQDSTVGEAGSFVLDLGNVPRGNDTTSLLDQLSSGHLNVAVTSMTDVDWAILNLTVETVAGVHRDMNGDVYYVGDEHSNYVQVTDDHQDGIVVEERIGDRRRTTAIANVERFYFHGNDGDDVLDGSRTSIPLIAAGGRGNDRLLGGTGADAFEGGLGDDLLAGFIGNDVYTFDTRLTAELGRDRVIDFATWAGGSNTLDVRDSDYASFNFRSADSTVNHHQEAWPLLTPGHFIEIVVESVLPKPIKSVVDEGAIGAALADDELSRRRAKSGYAA